MLLDIIPHLIASSVIIFALIFFLYNPFHKFLSFRELKLRERINHIIEQETGANQKLKFADQVLKDAHQSARAILKETKFEALQTKKQLLDQSQLQVKNMIENAKKYLVQTEIQADEELKKAVLQLSIHMTEKILKKTFDAGEQQQLVNDFIDKL
jgi:F-type H+-transporting ATPase subunit b